MNWKYATGLTLGILGVILVVLDWDTVGALAVFLSGAIANDADRDNNE